MRKLDKLTPQPVWNYFEDICQVPRPSKKEEKIIQFLLDFAKTHNLDAKTDEAGNVLITKPATSGMENAKTVILQSHIDMVCEKNKETVHNFDTDPIKPYIDGEWVKAEGTTLGADDGIGMAAQMAVLTATDIAHGPIECLFTVDEETGLTGAFALKPGFMTGTTLINLDSEDEGELFIGCAGGVDTTAIFKYEKESVPAGQFAIKISVSGLLGGHSGDDINKGRGNANKIVNRFLWMINNKYGIRLANFDAGNLRNAIAREGEAVFIVDSKDKEQVTAEFNIYRAEVENELKITEPNLKMELGSTDMPEFVLDEPTQNSLINALYACPHGVHAMSYRMPGMVETSTNLASVKFIEDNQILITTSQRSDLESGKWDLAQMVESVFILAGAEVTHGDGYPGWAPNPESEIMEITRDAYKRLFNVDPIVRSIHAGLECGLFLEKYPGMDMISFGPTLRAVHSPDEKINIETVQKFWDLLIEVLKTAK
ncbi:aminoacyl-histidine dipeptidase [Prolixibacteraceae bacterium JC049]|nr:aminoacyl-histidine dipeptidase [Prolixibacteraceae bacterium JC049]